MPASYTLSESVLEFTFEGKFTSAEGLAALEQGIASVPPGTRPSVLFDVTTSEQPPGSYEQVGRLSKLLDAHSASLSGRIGVLVSDQLRFGVARQFGALGEQYGFDVCPFLDRSAAVSWLQGGG